MLLSNDEIKKQVLGIFAEEIYKDKPHEISGMLLYAKTDEETYPDNDYKMSGNRIGVHTLDLNVEFPQIREQLDGIAARYLAYAEAINGAVFS